MSRNIESLLDELLNERASLQILTDRLAEELGRSKGREEALQALLNERDAEIDRLNPQWQSMDAEPPFPFTGDICLAGGSVRQSAAWCAGYWIVGGRSVPRDSVAAWRYTPLLPGPAL